MRLRKVEPAANWPNGAEGLSQDSGKDFTKSRPISSGSSRAGSRQSNNGREAGPKTQFRRDENGSENVNGVVGGLWSLLKSQHEI